MKRENMIERFFFIANFDSTQDKTKEDRKIIEGGLILSSNSVFGRANLSYMYNGGINKEGFTYALSLSLNFAVNGVGLKVYRPVQDNLVLFADIELPSLFVFYFTKGIILGTGFKVIPDKQGMTFSFGYLYWNIPKLVRMNTGNSIQIQIGYFF